MRLALALVALLPACSLYYHDDPGGGGGDPDADPGSGGGDCGTIHGELVTVKAIAGERTVAGVDSDGAGGIWIVYREQRGDYYSLADVWVTHLDAAGAKLSDWYYNDEYSSIGGIAYSGDALWVNYNAVGTDVDHLRKLDPATGETLGTFATPSGLSDVSYGNGKLYLAYPWNKIYTMDPTTGAIDPEIAIAEFPAGGTEHGIAYDAGNFWISRGFTDDVVQVNPGGAVIGTWTADAHLDHSPTETAGLQLAWTGTHLLVVNDNQIVWLEPR